MDDGNYTLSDLEYNQLLEESNNARKFLRKFIGAKELIRGIPRYCIWIDDSNLKEALSIKSIFNKINNVKKWRQNSDRINTKKLASTPHKFAEIRQPSLSYLAFPTVSSERRDYIPIDCLDSNIIASNQIFIIENAEPWVFAVITSKMHMVWVRTVGGRLKTDYRYSAELCYNTFPFPDISEEQKQNLDRSAKLVLGAREKYSERTLAELYDPDKMPENLLLAHQSLDVAVEQCYRRVPFTSDEKRLEYLFKMYEKMSSGETLNQEQLELL